MPSIELLYFDGAGRAEAIRICLHMALGAEGWTDTRFLGAEWPTLKPTTPLGSVPVLKIDGVQHCQSVSLMRFAGMLAGWYPKDDPFQCLVVDEAIDSLNELMGLAPRSSDKDELKKLREDYEATTMTKYATFLEAAIQRNGGTGFAFKPSIADLAMMSTADSIASGNWDYIDAKFFENYPGIQATVKAMKSNNQIKSYYDSKK
jgi:glutathione S-transferase